MNFDKLIADGLRSQIAASLAQAAAEPASAKEMNASIAVDTAVLALVSAHGVSAILTALAAAGAVAEVVADESTAAALFADFTAQLGEATETADAVDA